MRSTPSTHIYYTYIDRTASKASCRFMLPYVTNRTDATAAADSLRALLQSISSSVIVEQSIVYTSVDVNPPVALSGTDKRRLGVFIFEDANGDDYQLDVPGVRESVLLQSGPLTGVGIDTTDPDIAAFVQEIINDWVTEDNVAITSLVSAYLQEIG